LRALPPLLAVLTRAPAVRRFLATAVLPPALGLAVLVEHQRGLRPVREDALALPRAVVHAALPALRMPADAPAAAEDAAVALHQVGERVPGGRLEPPHGVLAQRRLLPRPPGHGNGEGARREGDRDLT